MRNSTYFLFSFILFITACKSNKQANPPATTNGSEMNRMEDAIHKTTLDSSHQSIDERIQSIRKMSATIHQLHEKQASNNCKKRKLTIYDTFSTDMAPRPFDQFAEHCTFENGFSLYKGEFNGHEWFESYRIYQKDGNIFFIFREYGNEACFVENRIYYDEKGQVIRLLEKAKNCDDKSNTLGHSKELDRPQSKEIIETTQLHFQKIIAILK